MKRVWTLVAAAVALVVSSAPRASATPPDGAVRSVSVVPATGRAEVVIGIDGAVTVQDFTLRNPDKIVVDITGASLGIPAGDAYDKVARGGITNVRYSQFRRNVVRVVLTLDGARQYTIVRGDKELRITVDGKDARFAAWTVGDEPLARATVTVPGSDAPARPVAKAELKKDAAATAAAPTTEARRDEVALAGTTTEGRTVPEPTVSKSKPMTMSAAHAATAMPQRSQQPRITIAWENADIHDVLAAFAAFSGRTIIPSRDVKGDVTAEIVNQPWDVAMRALLNANGFDATEDGNGIIIVDTFERIAARRSSEPLATRSIRLNYVKSVQVADLIRPRLSKDCGNLAAAAAANAGAPAIQPSGGPNCPIRGAVTADSLTNSVAITDVPSSMNELEEYVRSVDIRQPQVTIKAKIILVDRTQLEALGLRYDIGTAQQFFNDVIPRLDSTGRARVDAGQVFLGGNQVSAIANAQARVSGSALSLIYSTAFGDYSLTTFLEALQQNTLLDVQAEPSATVLNNRTANLTAGVEVPLRVIDASAGGSGGSGGQQGSGNFPRATVQLKPTGIILNVTPSVTNNRQVQMRVHVENSDVVAQGTDAYLFPRQTVDNEVLVADGETAVMGGLTQTTVRYTRSGIPILVDLPLIGRLFGLTRREEQKRDLLILLTPHIIDDGQQAPSSPPRE